MMSRLIFRQLFEKESSTYTYLLACTETKEAILIDPVIETAERDSKLISELGLILKYAINTHLHADHITGTGKLKSLIPGTQSAISRLAGAKADVILEDSDKINFGARFVKGISTPGHTSGCFSYVLDDESMVFTGDTLLIRGCGRTDFQGGSSELLYESVHKKLFVLPESCQVFPAHDYKGQTSSTIFEEKTHNPRLTKDQTGFIDIMANLNLSYPKKIDVSLPANQVCGIYDDNGELEKM